MMPMPINATDSHPCVTASVRETTLTDGSRVYAVIMTKDNAQMVLDCWNRDAAGDLVLALRRALTKHTIEIVRF